MKPTNGLDAASFIIFSSVRDAGNYGLDYTPQKDDQSSTPGLRGLSYPDDVVNFLTNFHNIENTSPFASTLLGIGGVKDIANAISNGESVIARFDWDHLTTGNASIDRLQRTFGSHYVQITGIYEQGNNIRLEYWSWGNPQAPIITSKDTFMQSVKGFSSFY